MPVPGGLAPRTLLRYLEENPIRKRKDPMPYSVYPLGPLETNSYLVYKDGQAVVIDAGGDPAEPFALLGGEVDDAGDAVLRHRDGRYGR